MGRNTCSFSWVWAVQEIIADIQRYDASALSQNTYLSLMNCVEKNKTAMAFIRICICMYNIYIYIRVVLHYDIMWYDIYRIIIPMAQRKTGDSIAFALELPQFCVEPSTWTQWSPIFRTGVSHIDEKHDDVITWKYVTYFCPFWCTWNPPVTSAFPSQMAHNAGLWFFYR